MKNYKIISLFLAFMLIISGCAASNEMATDSFYDGGNWKEQESFIEEPMEAPVTDEAFDSITADSSTSSEQSYYGSRKLIRTFELNVETLDFDDFIAAVKKEVSSVGGYIESSRVGGNSYNYSGNRSADFICRVPSDKLDDFIYTVGGLGNVTYSYEDTKDITLSYVDTEARVKSLQTEYDQLLELLAEAENLDTIILLQQRLTEVRYQLESYKSQLRTYDNLVDYSTVNLSVYEVQRVTPAEAKTVWQRISNDFGDNIYDIYIDAENFFVWFVANIPYFIIWAVIIAAVLFIISRIFKNNTYLEERRAARKARREYKKAQKLAKKNAAAEKNENTEEK